MADTEVELARRCVDEVGGGLENADLKIAAARLTKALSLLKHNDSNNGRWKTKRGTCENTAYEAEKGTNLKT